MTSVENSTQFLFKAVMPDGRQKRGMRAARDEAALSDVLREEGMLLLSARPLPAWTSAASQLPVKDQVALNQQLHTLLSRGVPLIEALDVAASVVSQPSRDRIERVRSLVRSGASFADACVQAGAADVITATVYRAAERTGDLDDACGRLAKAAQRRRAIGAKATTLMIYPLIVIIVSGAIAAIVLTVVVPTIGSALQDAGQPLPWYTQGVIGLGVLLRDNGLLVLLALVAAGVFCFVARRLVGALALAALRLLPPVQKLSLAMESARFFATMAAMTRSGVPVADALGVSTGAVSDPRMRGELEDLRKRLVEGGLLRTLIEEVASLPLATRRLLIAAERAGDLDSAFDTLADDMAQEVDRRAERLLAALEPAVIIAMFAVIGSLLMSIMIPMINLTSGAGLGG